ncbi:hypothetical protein SBA2_680011 [Acidobacteriia bacterium SbA2]|nr:hypothetical protein SBA2_680011 [Acidobacteriia bacterium SbA2]
MSRHRRSLAAAFVALYALLNFHYVLRYYEHRNSKIGPLPWGEGVARRRSHQPLRDG